MQVFPGGFGRIALLVIVLLVTCYFADWTDDYASYSIASAYSCFQSANGLAPTVSGGNSPSASMMAMAMRVTAGQQKSSALEAVFGAPTGLVQSDEADAASSGSANPFSRGLGLAGTNGRSSIQSGFGGLGSTSPGAGTSGLGFSGSSGASGLSATPRFGNPQ